MFKSKVQCIVGKSQESLRLAKEFDEHTSMVILQKVQKACITCIKLMILSDDHAYIFVFAITIYNQIAFIFYSALYNINIEYVSTITAVIHL